MYDVIQKFQERLDELKGDCQELAGGLRGIAQPRWMFSGKDGDTVKPGRFDFAGVHALFDRSEAADTYMEAIEESTAAVEAGEDSKRTKQELAIAKFQSDYLSGMERDFFMRKRSRVRMLAHEATARKHAGSGAGVFQSCILAYLQTQAQRASGSAGNGNSDS